MSAFFILHQNKKNDYVDVCDFWSHVFYAVPFLFVFLFRDKGTQFILIAGKIAPLPAILIILFLFFVFFIDNHFVDDYARFSTLDTKEKSTAVANSMNYMTKKGQRVFPGQLDVGWNKKTKTKINLVSPPLMQYKQRPRPLSFCSLPPPD